MLDEGIMIRRLVGSIHHHASEVVDGESFGTAESRDPLTTLVTLDGVLRFHSRSPQQPRSIYPSMHDLYTTGGE